MGSERGRKIIKFDPNIIRDFKCRITLTRGPFVQVNTLCGLGQRSSLL